MPHIYYVAKNTYVFEPTFSDIYFTGWFIFSDIFSSFSGLTAFISDICHFFTFLLFYLILHGQMHIRGLISYFTTTRMIRDVSRMSVSAVSKFFMSTSVFKILRNCSFRIQQVFPNSNYLIFLESDFIPTSVSVCDSNFLMSVPTSVYASVSAF